MIKGEEEISELTSASEGSIKVTTADNLGCQQLDDEYDAMYHWGAYDL